MNEPPINPDSPKDSALNEFYRANQLWIDRLAKAIIILIIGKFFHGKLNDIEGKQDANNTTTELVKDVATEAAKKADLAADVGKVNLVLNTEQRADYTGKDEHKVLAEAKASAEQLPTTTPAK